MADFWITRRGGKSADRTAAPSINFISATTTSLTFTVTNNENEQVTVYYGLDVNLPTTAININANATSSNITFSSLNNTTAYNINAYAFVNNPISKKIKSEIINTILHTTIPTPTITQVSKTAFTITFTVRNNSSKQGTVTYGLTTPPTDTVLTLNANTTSSNQTISNLDPVTTYTVFAQTQVPGFSDSAIVSSNVTTDSDIIYTVATGGTISTIGNHRYHVFTSNGTFSVSQVGTDNTVTALLVAGGGAGGGRHGGGGGAGGVLYGTIPVLNQSYSLIIGSGGNITQISSSTQGIGGNGNNTTVFGLTASGGGGGGSTTSPGAGRNGGSGGGGGGTGDIDGRGRGNATQTSSGGLTGYGNNGGTGTSGTSGAGGGGAVFAGQNAQSGDVGGAGGGGLNLSSVFPNWGTNTSNTTSGTRGVFGGGGGGGSQPVRTDTVGGNGGGGNGRGNDDGNAFNGQVNTGGGGGGHRSLLTTRTGGAGGSGIVIIRYVV